MKSLNHSVSSLRSRARELVLLLAATSAMACVGLDKPGKVKECAAANNCSDEPVRPPTADAMDTPSPEVDTADGAHDLAPEIGRDGSADVPGDHAPDVADAGPADTSDAEVMPAPDARPDLPPDIAHEDVGRDTAPDLAHDLAPDLAPDVTADLRPDLGPDLRPDVAPDLPPDLPPDLAPDISPDTSTLGTGLLAYYKCESATGTTLQDASGKGNHGTLASSAASGTSFRAGKVGNALVLAKAGQGYVSMPPAIFAGATELTVAAWVNVTTSQNWQRVLDVGVDAKLANNSSTGTRYMNLVPKNEGSNLAFAIGRDGYSNEQVLTAPSPATATWKHVAVVLGAGQANLYIDGAPVTNSTTVTLRPADLGTIDYAFLGKSQFTADPYFDGLLDEVRVYGRALTAAEVQALFEYDGS